MARITQLVGVAALIVAPLTAVATDAFSDVPKTHTHHNDITWFKGAAVTKGCNPPANTQYCPDNSLTRAQMATFMRNFAKYLGAEDGTPAQADNADTVDGQHAEDLINSASLLNSAGRNVTLPGGATEVLSLDLTPGVYLLSATGIPNNNAGSQQSVNCEFSAGTASIDMSSLLRLGPNGGLDRESVTIRLLADLDSTSAASLSCTTSGGCLGNVIRPQILAVSIQSAETSVAGASTSGPDDG